MNIERDTGDPTANKRWWLNAIQECYEIVLIGMTYYSINS